MIRSRAVFLPEDVGGNTGCRGNQQQNISVATAI